MNEEDSNRIPAMASHLVLTTIVVEALPDHATTNAPHIRWCRRLLMQVEEFAALPAETALPVFDNHFGDSHTLRWQPRPQCHQRIDR